MLNGDNRSWLLVALVVGSIGCGRDLSQYVGRQKRQAPQSKAETGLIVRGASEDQIAQLLENFPNAKFRTLNLQHQMFEVYGISRNQVQAELPTAAVNRNTFFTLNQKSIQSLRMRILAEPMGDQIQKCVESDVTPTAVISAETLTEELTNRQLPRNKVLRLNSSLSKNSPNGQKLRKAWVIMRPEGSLGETEELVASPTVEVATDAMGGYGVGLVVQDENNACGLDLLEFAVTDNATYAGPFSPGTNPLKDLDLNKLSHLASMHAKESWAVSRGRGQIVAVIDTGVNFNHPAVRDNILVNSKESANGADDDGNQFVDDVNGWDFEHGDNSPFDDVGHGSHVAGLAASSVFGLAKEAKVLPVKVLGAFGGDTGSVAAGIRYAVDRGAKVLNLSLGGYEGPDPEVVAAINYAETKGALVVAAAGNGDPMTGAPINTDETPNFPSALPNNNILSVAALNEAGNLASYSNFGLKTVDVAAPGGDNGEPIVSAYMENPQGVAFMGMAGTSMASPIVAGVAAQVWSANPTMNALQVKQILMSSGVALPTLAKTVVSGKKVDAAAAVTRARSPQTLTVLR